MHFFASNDINQDLYTRCSEQPEVLKTDVRANESEINLVDSFSNGSCSISRSILT